MVDYFYESLSRPLPDRRSTVAPWKAAASTRARLTRLHFCSFPFHARFSRDTAPSRRDVDHWEFAKGRGHLSATRMSFIVQIFSLLYSYRYIVTLRNVDCDGDHLCVAVSLLYFLIFLLNKCEHAENINMCVFTLYTSPCRSLSWTYLSSSYVTLARLHIVCFVAKKLRH